MRQSTGFYGISHFSTSSSAPLLQFIDVWRTGKSPSSGFPVAVHLAVDVPVVQLQGPQVQFSGCGRLCVLAETSSSSSLCRMGLRFVHRHFCRIRLRGYFVAVLMHFSASVHLDVEAQVAGTPESDSQAFFHQFDARMRRYGQTSRRYRLVCTTTTTTTTTITITTTTTTTTTCADTSMWAWMSALSLRGSVSCVHRRIAEVAAPVGDNGSGLCMAGFAGYVAFALCSLLLSAGRVVHFLDKLFSPVVVQRQVLVLVRTVLNVARGESTGAVLGRGYGHCDRCRGPDSVNCLEVP